MEERETLAENEFHWHTYRQNFTWITFPETKTSTEADVGLYVREDGLWWDGLVTKEHIYFSIWFVKASVDHAIFTLFS